MRIWIDDVRPVPATWKGHYVWAKTSEEAIEALAVADAYGRHIELISFDHDLGGEDTSRAVVLYMIENDIRADAYDVHSANPVGIEWLEGMIRKYLIDEQSP